MPNVAQMHDELAHMIDAAQADQDHESANRTFAVAQQLALQIIDANPNDAEACYAIALTWYHQWSPPSDRRKCVRWLRKTAECAPDHPWVPLYLGYQFFDDKQYGEAFSEFSRVDLAYFSSIEHHWRNVKTHELLLCCRILGDFSIVDIESLTQLVTEYVDAETVDRPIPSDIIKTLIVPESRERFDVEPHAVAKEMCRLIEGIGDHNVFAAELAHFQAVTQNAV